MARKSLELRREEILAEAARQLQRHGPAALRAADVAGALGVSTALIFYHFDTKERLLAETFGFSAQRDLDRLDAVLAGPGTALERLWAVLDLYAPTGDASGWVLWIDGWSAAQRDDALRAVVGRLDRRWKRAIASLVREVASGGGVDAGAAATRITALLDGLAVQRVVRREALGAARVRQWVRAFVAGELGLPPDAILTHQSVRKGIE
ncbi:MAG: TetR/AcrR family transcriptional regulator [Actinomycetota bacterium]|jgi:AcrR family transcriptional regulator|nr:TetR/AcrR family transcriptional regulator [Actinomycetota bacterium]